ncbi:hypothetical protein GPJ56_004119 [Histomonas meleagridis]|uniref:uncharacterized protein n=1 Tax=Histomonas meleagridis TaxID=135588 RepID=UPI00355A4024|nr:hypothetical protein GPJ56_004119 [Histomonas meleagridis]KAH0801460.1 hypothetical protein GO595_005712 [Histomonas meleagridis]
MFGTASTENKSPSFSFGGFGLSSFNVFRKTTNNENSENNHSGFSFGGPNSALRLQKDNEPNSTTTSSSVKPSTSDVNNSPSANLASVGISADLEEEEEDQMQLPNGGSVNIVCYTFPLCSLPPFGGCMPSMYQYPSPYGMPFFPQYMPYYPQMQMPYYPQMQMPYYPQMMPVQVSSNQKN